MSSFALWWNSPVLVEYALRSRLAANGLHMPEFVMEKPYHWPVLIDNIKVVTPSLEISLSGIEISLINGSSPEIHVFARQATFIARLLEDEATTSLDWQTLIESIDSRAVFLPSTGEIEQLRWCREDCFEGRLNWRRRDTHIDAWLHIPALDRFGSFSWQQDKATLRLTGYRDQLFFVEVEFAPGDREIGIDGHARFRADTQPINLHGEGPIHYKLEVSAFNADFTGHLPLEGIVSTASIKRELQAMLMISGEPSWQVEFEDTRLSSQQLLNLEIEVNEGVLDSRLTKSIDIKLETPFIEQATLAVASGTQCSVGENVSCTSPQASLTARLESYDVFTAFSATRFALHDGNWQLTTTADLVLTDDNTTLISAELELTADNRGLHARASTASILGVSIDKTELSHNLKSGKGQLALNVSDAATEFQSVVDYLQLQKLKLVRGEISLATKFLWDIRSVPARPVFETTITVTGLDAAYDDYQFQRGSIDMQLTGWPRIKSTRPVSMSWRRLEIGVPIEDIQMSFDLDLDPRKAKYIVIGRNFDAAVFSGHLSSKDYNYEVTSQTGYLALILEKLELDQILALQEEEFESSGKISGSVPVHINKGKLSVSKGTITAIEPGGFIRYKPSPAIKKLVAQNEQLKVIVDTMSDFQYHSLEAELEYSPEGDMVARTTLKGSNPAYENGREIHLNIRVEENVATLLKSLRLSGKLTDQISEKAKRGVRQ